MEAGRFLGQARSELIEQRGEDPGRLARRFAPAPGFERCRLRAWVGTPRYAATGTGSRRDSGRSLLRNATAKTIAKTTRRRIVSGASPVSIPA